MPEFAPEPKVAQLLIFGARVIRVKGSYDETWELCQRACARHGWYNRNAAVNPSLVEGKKTCGLEIGEQTGAEVPDWVAVSVGDGCTIAGIWKGLDEMRALGFIPRVPRMLGVQAEGARPLVDAFRDGRRRDAVGRADDRRQHLRRPSAELAQGAARGARLGRRAAWRCPTRRSSRRCARRAAAPGVFGEPAGVAGLAGVRAAVEDGIVGPRRDRPRRGDRQRPQGRAHGDARGGGAGDRRRRTTRRVDAHLDASPLP